MSHTRHRPSDQGMMETPSGRFPSDRQRPLGSKVAGIFTAERARLTMSLRAECLGSLPWLRRQLKPCKPDSSTRSPQRGQSCGKQREHPRRRPTATRTQSSSKRRPRDEMGGALSHAPDSFCWAAKV